MMNLAGIRSLMKAIQSCVVGPDRELLYTASDRGPGIEHS